MSDLPAEYHFHQLQKLFGEYTPTRNMPCWQCREPEAWEIRIAFVQFGCTAHKRMPPGTAPVLDRISALAEPVPEPEADAASASDPVQVRSLDDDNLFMLRDYFLRGEKIVAAAIKAAGGARWLARKLGIHREIIEQWKRVPAERLQAVAEATGLPQHVLRPDLFDVAEPQTYWTEAEEKEVWAWHYAQQLWLPLPYPPGFLPLHCCARRPRLTLVRASS